MQRWQASSRAAFISPLIAFLVLSEVARWLRIDNPELPWHQRAPELWVYPLQCVICLAMLAFWRRHYRFGPWTQPAVLLAIAAAIVGIAVWLAPSALYASGWRGLPWEWIGVVERLDGFDPQQAEPSYFIPVVALRFLRLVVVVPLVEEIFWRGFLMRALIDGGRRFDEVPFGTFGWRSVVITTLLFVLVHQPSDYFAALIYGSLAALVAVRGKSLGACVLMHALANLILGIYVMQTRFWGLW